MYQGHVLDKEPQTFFISSGVREIFLLWCHSRISMYRSWGTCAAIDCIPPYKRILALPFRFGSVPYSLDLDFVLSQFMFDLLQNLSYPSLFFE